jgi:DNA-binding NarL/FixJ family response regulator
MAGRSTASQPVQSDDLADAYSNRPFGKVFEALRQIEEHLQPVFTAAGTEPFKPGPQAYTRRKTIDEILKLHEEGMSPEQIAERVGKSSTTVQRHIQRAQPVPT